MRRRVRILVLAMAGALFLSGCSSPAASGRWGSSLDTEPFIEIRVGGQLSGFDGCNGFGGTWKDEAGTAVFLEVASTLIACDGEPAQWLGLARSAKTEDQRLVLFGEDGAELGSLSRP